MSRPQVSSNVSPLKKNPFDYSDHHYRDAICRLKVMLSDSSAPYVPSKFSSSLFKSTVTDDDTDTTENTIVDRTMMGKATQAPYKSSYSTYSMASSTYKPSKHLPVPGVLNIFKSL